jgi:hypothetical protein
MEWHVLQTVTSNRRYNGGIRDEDTARIVDKLIKNYINKIYETRRHFNQVKDWKTSHIANI